MRILTGLLYLLECDTIEHKDGPSYTKMSGKALLDAFVIPNDIIPKGKPLQGFEALVEAAERASSLEFY